MKKNCSPKSKKRHSEYMREYMKEYSKLPKVKSKKRAYYLRPEVKERRNRRLRLKRRQDKILAWARRV